MPRDTSSKTEGRVGRRNSVCQSTDKSNASGHDRSPFALQQIGLINSARLTRIRRSLAAHRASFGSLGCAVKTSSMDRLSGPAWVCSAGKAGAHRLFRWRTDRFADRQGYFSFSVPGALGRDGGLRQVEVEKYAKRSCRNRICSSL